MFARLKTPVASILRDAGVLATAGEEAMYPTVRAAVEAAGGDPEHHSAAN